MLGKNLIKAAAGNVGGEVIEDLFQTWLYTGNGSTQTITNGIDLAGRGGLVWVKHRTDLVSHALFDTLRGATNFLSSNTTNANVVNTETLQSFSSTGFSVGTAGIVNGGTGQTYASWTFRKAPGFFDIVTYTGTGVARTVAHNLGSVPGTIIVKRTDLSDNWAVYHTSLGNTKYLELNQTAAAGTDISRWNNTTPTSTVFTVGTDTSVNASGGTYVAYLFAHDAQIFGEGGDQSVIKCGSYTGNGSTYGPTIDLGWEPQWVMIKRSSGGVGEWHIFDNMRGVVTEGTDRYVFPNTSDAENFADLIDLTSTGFIPKSNFTNTNWSGSTYIYIAIRRGPMKTPTSGTEVFKTEAVASDANNVMTDFPVDLTIDMTRNGAHHWFATRLTGANVLRSNLINAEDVNVLATWWDSNTLMKGLGATNQPAAYQLFRRAPGFFDVVAYTGTGVARTVAHNLGVAPELMIIKGRSVAQDWVVYSASEGASKAGYLNTTAAFFSDSGNAWNNTSPTASVFTVNVYSSLNGIGNTYIAYLFATLPGVSKCFNYTGTGTTLQIDCGFTSGARLVLIKRTDSVGDWYIWDSARGIVSGNDPYLLLNSTAAEVANTDYIDPYSAGFEISNTAPAAINASGGSYIGLAIA